MTCISVIFLTKTPRDWGNSKTNISYTEKNCRIKDALYFYCIITDSLTLKLFVFIAKSDCKL